MKAKVSAQARQVLNVLAARRCHLTADEILENLEGIGTATVYRALDHLTEMGLIRRHFVCETCGSVYDIEADFTGMAAEAAKCCGHQVTWCEVTAHGVCKDCLSRQKASTDEG